MEAMEVGLFNKLSVPPQLIGCKKSAITYQDIMSPRFFEALHAGVLPFKHVASAVKTIQEHPYKYAC
jgi:hypothetical protein